MLTYSFLLLSATAFAEGRLNVPPLGERLIDADLVVAGRLASIGTKRFSIGYPRGQSVEYIDGSLEYSKVYKGTFTEATIPIILSSGSADPYRGLRGHSIGEAGIWTLKREAFSGRFLITTWNPIPLSLEKPVSDFLEKQGAPPPTINKDSRPLIKKADVEVETLEVEIPDRPPLRAGQYQNVSIEFDEPMAAVYGLIGSTTVQFYADPGSVVWRAEVDVPKYSDLGPEKFMRVYGKDEGGNSILGTDRKRIPAWWLRRGRGGTFPRVGDYPYIKYPITE
jgi:hypothetical protein